MAGRSVSKSNPSGNRKTEKPAKPHKDFPLFAHATRRWAKKVRGKLHYFGPWDDPDGALAKWLDQKDALLAGRKPRQKSDGLTVRDLCNHFLTTKQRLLDNQEIRPITFRDYHAACNTVVATLTPDRLVSDLDTEDFGLLRGNLAKVRGPVSLGNEIQRVRTIFKHGYESGLIEAPMRFGPGFKKPSAKVLRKHRQEKPPKLFEAAEARTLLADPKLSPQLRAMILLGLNAGMGNSDLAQLPLKAVDIKGGWIDHPRPKTAVERRCPLWRETCEAIKAAIKARPKPKGDTPDDLLFVTRCGAPWVRLRPNDVVVDAIGLEFGKLLKRAGLVVEGRRFYGLRHTFQTVADGTRDFPAIMRIMGHAESANDMAARYRERIDDDRLKAVTDHVRGWLFPPAPKTKTKAKRTRKKQRAGD